MTFIAGLQNLAGHTMSLWQQARETGKEENHQTLAGDFVLKLRLELT